MINFKHINKTDVKYHYMFQKGTVAIQVCSKKDLETMFTCHAEGILLPVGVSFLHPDDQYCKATGRTLAQQKLNFTKCYLDKVEFRVTDNNTFKHVYHFHTTVPCSLPRGVTTQMLNFGLSTIAETEEARLVYANFV